jgi:hypothetical protein
MRISVSIAFFAAALCSSTLTPAASPTTYRVTEVGADDSATKFTSEVAARWESYSLHCRLRELLRAGFLSGDCFEGDQSAARAHERAKSKAIGSRYVDRGQTLRAVWTATSA